MSELQTLAQRVSRHDSTAVPALRQELESQMVRIVRRVMRTGIADTPLTKRILAEAGQQLGQPMSCPTEEGRRRAQQVASRLCETVVGGLQSSPISGQDTKNTVLDR